MPQESRKTTIYRFIYFFSGRQIVFVHSFQKKTQKTPRREIDIANKRMEHSSGPPGDAQDLPARMGRRQPV